MIHSLPVTRIQPVVFLPFFARTFRDHSGNGNHGTPSGVAWTRRGGRDLLAFNASGEKVTISDSPELQGTSFSIFMLFDVLIASTAGDRLVAKRDGGGTNYETFLGSATAISVFDGATQSDFLSVAYAGKNTIAITGATGEKPKLYLDGVYEKEGDSTLTITADDADLLIGGSVTSPTAYSRNPVACVVGYGDVLAAAEVADLHAYSQERGSPIIPSDRRYWDFGSRIRPQQADQIAAWDLGEISQRTAPDKSGNGYDGTVTGGVGPEQTIVGRAAKFGGAAVVNNVTLSATINLGKTHTILGTLSGNTSNTMVLALDTLNVALYLHSNIWYYRAGTGGQVTWANTPDGNFHRYAIVRSGTSVELFIDGVSLGGETLGADNDLTLRYIGNSAGLYCWVGTIKDIELRNRALSDAEIAADYAAYASKVMFHEDWAAARPSVANETSGMLGNTGWSIESGTWKISESATWEGAECVVAGQLKYRGLNGASGWTIAEFEQESGTPTLMKNAADLQIDALATEKIGVVRLTLG